MQPTNVWAPFSKRKLPLCLLGAVVSIVCGISPSNDCRGVTSLRGPLVVSGVASPRLCCLLLPSLLPPCCGTHEGRTLGTVLTHARRDAHRCTLHPCTAGRDRGGPPHPPPHTFGEAQGQGYGGGGLHHAQDVAPGGMAAGTNRWAVPNTGGATIQHAGCCTGQRRCST